MFEVLLSDAFSVCFGQSTRPGIFLFKRFQEIWSKLNHREPIKQSIPIIAASDNLKTFISQKLKLATKLHRDDYRELLNLASLVIGVDIQFTIWKPSTLHRARWMAKAIYSLKMKLLFNGNEARMALESFKLNDLCISHSFFETTKIESSFLTVPVKDWPETPSYKEAAIFAKHLVCVNDVVEQAVALIKDFNCATKNKEQKQFLLQVVEMYRKNFKQCNHQTLLEM
ncbi:hypothetical protein AVEN_102790-1 [Araneus ventricosus]|uniref:Uncharacterized protein n=1 Tax=Araneus ventricosus TaxID=182803 RepID=A0A4Y2KJC2_ARAVE|nr:hypothetical protein AVEN_102790-1 [Araneus ventricosus]